ncbi:boLa class II histocompatibility antigen, DQB*0101 beta chain-like isoform X2 [Sardina pilchardus]|uniref:boLa class II histocompatibility antigen, DQB*0101 beta chain-like isoform X2 n=1 Tax=Sardina pilchardus TaxID=27697 RepID=UPI002E13D37F
MSSLQYFVSGVIFASSLLGVVEPEVRLNLVKPSSGGHPAMLMCSAYGFFPKTIYMTWYRDEQEVTSNVVFSEELADGDWYYQMHSHLQFTPKAGEKISCVVEHAGLKNPKELVWDSSMPESERNMIAIGVAALVLGLVIAAAGFIYNPYIFCYARALPFESEEDHTVEM